MASWADGGGADDTFAIGNNAATIGQPQCAPKTQFSENSIFEGKFPIQRQNALVFSLLAKNLAVCAIRLRQKNKEYTGSGC
jgi:hypothetical protein